MIAPFKELNSDEGGEEGGGGGVCKGGRRGIRVETADGEQHLLSGVDSLL